MLSFKHVPTLCLLDSTVYKSFTQRAKKREKSIFQQEQKLSWWASVTWLITLLDLLDSGSC